jgi:GNAT superfamily N-acetyltransferase
VSQGRDTLALTKSDQTTEKTTSTAEEDGLRDWVPEPLDDRLALHHVSPYSDLGDRAEQFVYDTYRVSGFCKESPRRWVEETDPWREGSTLHVVTDGDDVLGVLRTMVGEFRELPVSQFDPCIPMRSGRLVEGGSLAVKADHRGLGIANELHRLMFRIGIEEGVEGWAMLIDAWMADFLREVYVFPTHVFSERRQFMGGMIEPIVVWVDELLVEMSSRRPALYRHAIRDFTPEQIVALDLPIVLD